MQSESKKTEYLDQKELQAIFGFGRDKMKRFLASGIIPVVRLNDNYYISQKQLDAWFQKNSGKSMKF